MTTQIAPVSHHQFGLGVVERGMAVVAPCSSLKSGHAMPLGEKVVAFWREPFGEACARFSEPTTLK